MPAISDNSGPTLNVTFMMSSLQGESGDSPERACPGLYAIEHMIQTPQ
jgi:hypothetical protein